MVLGKEVSGVKAFSMFSNDFDKKQTWESKHGLHYGQKINTDGNF
jgi:hypothetical protein